MSINFLAKQSSDIEPFIEPIGQIRIKVFSEWPYLYEGDMDYERSYLGRYSESANSYALMAKDGEKLIGATTALSLLDESKNFQRPFLLKRIPIEQVMYFGESVLLKEYRGRGIGKIFMDERLKFAKSTPGIKMASFCSVIRDPKHPMRPSDTRDLDTFWESYGFKLMPDMKADYPWKDHGEDKPSLKQMQFWIKTL